MARLVMREIHGGIDQDFGIVSAAVARGSLRQLGVEIGFNSGGHWLKV